MKSQQMAQKLLGRKENDMVSLHGGNTMDSERRKHKRIPLKFTVLCQKVGLSDGRLYSGNTVNVSPGGMLVEVNQSHLRDGELVSVEMTVPPTEGLLEYGGRFSSYARIIRVADDDAEFRPSSPLGGIIAMEFCESPRLRV
jgi:hypothetical protein